jgi:hypothetical protein
LDVFTVTFVAAPVVNPATVNVPLRTVLVSPFNPFTLNVCTSPLFVRVFNPVLWGKRLTREGFAAWQRGRFIGEK